MKLTKFLVALTGAATFVACTQEENLFKAESAPQQQMEEIVGANLVGTGISINATMGGSVAQTRYADGNNGWGEGDVVGLGWLICDGTEAGDTQSEDKKPGGSVLYANHMFDTEDKGVTWTTKGNVYEGWYYAYYPWRYHAKPKTQNLVELNPAMEGAGAPLHMSQSLYVSSRQFVSQDDLNVQKNSLESSFDMNQAVKFIQITAKAQNGSAFAKGKALSDLDIKSIKITATDKEVFAKEAVVYGKHLPVKVESADDATAEEKAMVKMQNLVNFRDAYSSAVVAQTKSSSIERNVEKAGVKVSTNPTEEGKNVNVYLNVLPGVIDLKAEDITIEVSTSGSTFVITKANTPSDVNKDAIDAFVAAFQKGGALSTIKDVNEAGEPIDLKVLKINLELCGDDYTTDYSNIDSYDRWETAVNEVNTLGLAEATFNITGDIEFTDQVLMPASAKLNVETPDGDDAKKIVLKSGTFEGVSDKLLLDSDVEVNVLSAATVNQAHTILASTIHNYGTLNVPVYTGEQDKLDPSFNTLSNVVNYGNAEINLLGNYAKVSNVDNSLGRINIIYGSFVELATDTKPGVIAYQVLPADVTAPKRIQTVINPAGENEKGSALVNTLVFDSENGIEAFDFTFTETGSQGSDDPYNPGMDVDDKPATYDGLGNVDLEIVKVDVKSSTEDVTVADVVITDANLGDGITVSGNLHVVSGDVVVSTPAIKGALTIAAGQGVITSDAEIKSVDIKSGNFTINASSITDAATAVGENYFNVTTFKNVVNFTNTSDNAIVLDGVTFEDDVTLNGTYALVNSTISGSLTVNGDVKVENATVDVDVTVNGGSVNANELKIDGTLTINTGAEVVLNSNKTMKMTAIVNNGGTLVTNNDIKVIDVTLKNQSRTTLGENWDNTVWYTDKYIHNNSQLNGYVKKAQEIEFDQANSSTANGALLVDAINAAQEGAVIYVPAGVYEFSSTFVTTGPFEINKSISIVGEEGTIIKGHYDNASWLKATRVLKIDTGLAKNVLLQNLNFVGTSGEYAGANIYIRNTKGKGDSEESNIVLKNVKCQDVRIENAYIEGQTINGTLENCTIDKFTIGGWYVNGTPGYSTLTYDASNTISSLFVDEASKAELSTINGVQATKVGEQLK